MCNLYSQTRSQDAMRHLFEVGLRDTDPMGEGPLVEDVTPTEPAQPAVQEEQTPPEKTDEA